MSTDATNQARFPQLESIGELKVDGTITKAEMRIYAAIITALLSWQPVTKYLEWRESMQPTQPASQYHAPYVEELKSLAVDQAQLLSDIREQFQKAGTKPEHLKLNEEQFRAAMVRGAVLDHRLTSIMGDQ